MDLKSIQILIDVTGENQYTMQYPETVNLKLQLSRSADWWGVFLSIVENFEAIKEDRVFLLNAFNAWNDSGYSQDFEIKITIGQLYFDEYLTIYTGFALPQFEDDTYTFTTRFEENNTVSKFLEGTIEKNLNFATDRDLILFPSNLLNRAHRVFNANVQNFNRVRLNSQAADPSDESRTIDLNGNNYIAITKSIINAGLDNFYTFINTIESPTYLDYLFDDNLLRIPKRAEFYFSLNTSDSIFFTYLLPHYKDENNDYKLINSFAIRPRFLNEEYLNELEFNFTVGEGYYRRETGFIGYANLETNARFLDLICSASSPNDEDDSKTLAWNRRSDGNQERYYNLGFYTVPIQQTIDALNIGTIINGLFDIGIDSPTLRTQFNNYALFPFDGAIRDTSELNVNINVSELLTEIKKALSVGVTVNPENNRLTIKHITQFFTNNPSVEISEENISSLTVSTNSALTIGRLVLGADNRDFNYVLNTTGQNIQTTYTARNAFSGSLELNLNRYKAQMYDFIDLYKEDLFELYSNERNDDEFCLFQNQRIDIIEDDNILRFEGINSGHTAVSQVCSWSWLLQTISPNGFDSASPPNYVRTGSPRNGFTRELTDNIEPTNPAFTEYDKVITLRKINAVIKLNTQQYQYITNNRDDYLILNYRGVQYQGYINNLTIDIGKSMIAEVELLERFQG